MTILSIDPGDVQSAYIVWNGTQLHGDIVPNHKLLDLLPETVADILCIEMVACYGMPVGKTVFETCVWIGRFHQIWNHPSRYIYRSEVKMHHCQSMRAKDSNIRQSLIDRFGPPGTKKAPGLTYSLRKDMWSAFAIATYAFDTSSRPDIKLVL